MTALRLATLLSLAAALFVAACTPLQGPVAEPVATEPPIEAVSPISPDQQAMADATVMWAAEQLGVSAEEIAMVSIEAIEWPDSALGCPQPDMVYAAVITPGYQVTITAQGTTYLVHTDSLSEGEKIICTQ